MAHFPASLSMSRLAGSSGTQKVCETTKSRNRTGGIILFSSSSQVSRPPTLETELEGSKDLEVHSAVKADPVLQQEQVTDRAPTRELEVLYVVTGYSGTSVRSTIRRRGAIPLAVAAAAFEKTLRRLCSRLFRQRHSSVYCFLEGLGKPGS